MSIFAEYRAGLVSAAELNAYCRREEAYDRAIEEAEAERQCFYDNYCQNCKHDSDDGCSCNCTPSADCPYEEREAMTLQRALKILECIEINYGTDEKDEITEIDRAFDCLFGYGRRYIKDNTAEWKNNVCSRCGQWAQTKTTYCGHCGRLFVDKKGE